MPPVKKKRIRDQSGPVRTPAALRERRRKLYHPVKTPEGWIVAGRKLKAVNDLTVLLFAFKMADNPDAKEYLFWEIADLLWNKDPDDKHFAKTKWAYQIIHNACREKYLAIGGAGSSGKSYVCAGWGLVNWLCDPSNTLVLMTSTDIAGAKKRIFGATLKLLGKIPDAPCKVVESFGLIKYYDGNVVSNTAGIHIVTADKNAERVGKLIGIKAPRVILIADELGEMGTNVQAAAIGNLSKNPNFQMIGLSNPASRFDPFGIFSKPKDGWESVNNENDYEWRTHLNGLYIRLNSELSPNIDTEPSLEYEVGEFYPYLPTQEQMDEALSIMGSSREEARNSREYRRFNLAIFYDSNDSDTVYSEGELLRAGAFESTEIIDPVTMAGADLGFSANGDSTVIVFIDVGFNRFGQHCAQFKDMCHIFVDETRIGEYPRTHQIADRIIAECKKRNVRPEHFALDATGGGGGVSDVLRIQWNSDLFMRVEFGGSASNRRIKNDSKLTGKDRYKNKASELFFIGKQYLLGRQLTAIPHVIADQLCKRQCLEPTKGPMGVMLQVEPKKLFKARVGKSPDEADAYLVAIEGARIRQMFTPADPVPQKAIENTDHWLKTRRTHKSFSADRMGFVANL